MRSHAKASPVGSNSGRGASRRPFRRPGALAAVLVALLAAAWLLPGSASAIEFRTQTGSFGPDGTSGSSFEVLGPLAFDQGNKHLYGFDQEAGLLYGFDASTPPSHPELGGSFPMSRPSGYEDDVAVDSSTHDIYLTSHSGHQLQGFDESGAAISGFPLTGFSYICGVTVDSAGNIWIADASEEEVKEYSPAGALLESFSVSGEPCRIAVDAEENVFVGIYLGSVVKYTAASGYTTSSAVDSEYSWAIALDRSTDELFVVHYESIAVFDTETGALLYKFGENIPGNFYYGELSGITVDEASEEVFVADSGHAKIDVFGPPASVPKAITEAAGGITTAEATVNGKVNPKGLALKDCHFEVVPASQFISTKYTSVTTEEKFPCVPAVGSIPVDSEPHAVSADVTGLNPASVYHFRLVAKNEVGEGAGADRQFTTGPMAPLIEGQTVQAVGTTDVTVAAKINPRGGQTTYHVEYGTTEAYGQSTAESAPFGFSSDASAHSVSVHIGGLEPGTVYHLRFVATNEVDTTEAADTSFATYPNAQSFAPCPNDEFRTGFGERLPDCRAYEQGSPIDKNGAGIQLGGGAVSPSGNRFTFVADGGLETTGGLSALAPYLATRGPDGWSFDGLLPSTREGFLATIIGGNEDLSSTLVSGQAPAGGWQLFLRDSDTAAFQPGPVSAKNPFPQLVGFTEDPSHLFFTTRAQLLPSAAAGVENLYELDHGNLSLADRIPAGSATSCDDESGPACVVPPQGSERTANNSKVSSHGSRVFFTVQGAGEPYGSGALYMREGARTTWISASQRAVPDPGGEKPAEFLDISSDGSKVFFLSCEKLTDDSTAHSTVANSCRSAPYESVQGSDLYLYDVESGELTDLTVDSEAGDPLGAAVNNKEALGASEDGSYFYFFADGVLAPGASHSQCLGYEQKCNLYVYHEGSIKLIARTPMGPGASTIEPRVGADGKTLLFSSLESLTGYDNVTSVGGACGGNEDAHLPCREFFRYSAPEDELLCVTCLPTGSKPTRAPQLFTSSSAFGSGEIIGGGKSRNLSANGKRVFFENRDAMVPTDTNGVRDVYEWEARGEGSCESESQDGGCIYLISSGTDPESSTFLGASRNGDHVFFYTEQKLVPTDEDQLVDVYEAAVGGGLASQHTLAPPTCASTACQANPTPPPDQTPASATFKGPGNAKAPAEARKCPKGKRRVKARCVRRHATRHHRRHPNRANVDRGGSK